MVVVGSPTTDLLESVDCSFRDAISQMLRPKERSIQLEISVRQAKHDSYARDNVKHDLESLLEQIDFSSFLSLARIITFSSPRTECVLSLLVSSFPPFTP